MATPMVIGQVERAELGALKRLAWRADRIIPLDKLIAASKGFDPGAPDTRGKSIYPLDQTIELALGWKVTFSVEYQPDGATRHMSVSSPVPGRFPSAEAIAILASLLGFVKNVLELTMYFETYKPGHKAVNLLEVVEVK